MSTNKPPLGLRPREVVDNLRIQEISEAVDRYLSKGMPIPTEWSIEYCEILSRIRRRQSKANFKELPHQFWLQEKFRDEDFDLKAQLATMTASEILKRASSMPKPDFLNLKDDTASFLKSSIQKNSDIDQDIIKEAKSHFLIHHWNIGDSVDEIRYERKGDNFSAFKRVKGEWYVQFTQGNEIVLTPLFLARELELKKYHMEHDAKMHNPETMNALNKIASEVKKT